MFIFKNLNIFKFIYFFPFLIGNFLSQTVISDEKSAKYNWEKSDNSYGDEKIKWEKLDKVMGMKK